MLKERIISFLYDKMERELNYRIDNSLLEIPNSSTPIEADENADLTFAVFGDPQVSSFMFAREACFYSAVLDIKNMNSKLNALVIAGDIAENGLHCEYRTVARFLNEISHRVDNFLLLTGNHDLRLRGYKAQQEKFRAFVSSVHNSIPLPKGKYYTSTEICGYRFILLGSDKSTFEGSYLSDKQLSWLREELEKCKNTNKPVFLFNHQTLKRHNGLPVTWLGKGNRRGSVGFQSNKLKELIEGYNNVVLISGHLHYGTCEYTFDDRGSYKCISVPTVGANNHGSYSALSQGLVFSVYKNRVRVRSREFGKGSYTPQSITNSTFEFSV